MNNPEVTCTHVWAVPGRPNIIDEIDPVTGLTRCLQRDAADVLAHTPEAVRMTWDEWTADQAARQHTPIAWRLTDRERYDEMLNVLPPAAHVGGAFLVGEPMDHDVTTGRPRFSAFWATNGLHYAASRPMTVAEFRAELTTGRTVQS